MTNAIIYLRKAFKYVIFLIIDLLSTTRLIAKILNRTDDVKKHSNIVKNFNFTYLSLTIFIVLFFISDDYFKLLSIPGSIMQLIYLISFFYSFSRVNEVFFAFLIDASEKLKKKEQENQDALKYYERINLALKSYFELILDYGIIFYVLSKGTFQPLTGCKEAFIKSFDGIIDAIYFSGVTITTLGYGDWAPNCFLAKFFCLYSVANGMLLIIVCFTVYVSLAFCDSKNKFELKKSSSISREIILLILNIILVSLFSYYLLAEKNVHYQNRNYDLENENKIKIELESLINRYYFQGRKDAYENFSKLIQSFKNSLED